MQNALQEFVKFKKAVKEAYDYENPYDSNESKFEGVMSEYEEKVQEMKNLTMESNGKRIKQIMDKYFAPRSTLRIQHSIKSVLIS